MLQGGIGTQVLSTRIRAPWAPPHALSNCGSFFTAGALARVNQQQDAIMAETPLQDAHHSRAPPGKGYRGLVASWSPGQNSPR